MLLQDGPKHFRSFMVIIISSWIVAVYLFEPWEPIYSTCHIIPFLFQLPWTCFFMSKCRGRLLYGTPIPCSQFVLESVLFFVVCVFLYIRKNKSTCYCLIWVKNKSERWTMKYLSIWISRWTVLLPRYLQSIIRFINIILKMKAKNTRNVFFCKRQLTWIKIVI